MSSSRARVLVHVSPIGIEVFDNATGSRLLTGPTLTLTPQKGRAAVTIVGDEERLVRQEIEEQKRAGTLPPSFAVFAPGTDAWWDTQWAWPPSQGGNPSAPGDDSQALVIDPLHSDTWSPPLIHALVRYALFCSLPRSWSSWPLLRPSLELQVSPEFDAVQRAEVLDVVEEIWGRSRVVGLDDVKRTGRASASLGKWTSVAATFLLVLLQTRLHCFARHTYALLSSSTTLGSADERTAAVAFKLQRAQNRA